LGAATTAASEAASAARIAGSSFCQPVVPLTTLMPRARSTGTFLATESGVEKSIATSTPCQRPASGPSWPDGDSGSITPATVDPYSPERLSTIRPILP